MTSGQGPTTGLLEQMQRIVTGLERQLASLADENRSLREQLASLLPPLPAPALPVPACPDDAGQSKPERKTGAALVAANAFWDGVVEDLAGHILAIGRPMSADELLLEIPQNTRDFAVLAFQRMNKKSLRHKLGQRIEGEKYGLFRTAEKLYCVVPLAPDRRQNATADEAA